MLNTNVGDMPLDIFCDYISDILGQEWQLEHIAMIINEAGHCLEIAHGDGTLGVDINNNNAMGDGNGDGYGTAYLSTFLYYGDGELHANRGNGHFHKGYG
jgi:hypothetical protein